MPAHGIRLQYFHGGSHPRRTGSIDADQLASFLQRSLILPAREWLARSISGELGAHDACLTFDGNLMCQRDVALPVLREFGLTAFWFTCSAPLQGHPVQSVVDQLFGDMCFTAHSHFQEAFVRQLECSQHWPMVEMLLEERPARCDRQEIYEFIRDDILGPTQYREVMDALMNEKGFDARAAVSDLWMNDTDIRALYDAGHVIGLHSHTCPARIDKLDEDAQREEYFENYAYLHHLL